MTFVWRIFGPLAALALMACHLGTNGLGPEPSDASVTDGSGEATLPEATDEAPVDDSGSCNQQTCGGACCGGQCIPRTCSGCAAGALLCSFAGGPRPTNGYCTSTCAGCETAGSTPVMCFSCSGGSTSGICAISADQCPQDLDAGACSCTPGDAGQCPGPTQVCTLVDGQGVCITP